MSSSHTITFSQSVSFSSQPNNTKKNKTVKNFFTDDEWETISCALEDYINYDDPDAHPSDLIGGISVADRVNSIDRKLSQLYVNTQGRDT